MGRKAKLKQARKSVSNETKLTQSNPDQFVQHLERQGYSLKQAKMAPEMPDKSIEPQI